MPRVSVIIPTHHRPSLLPRAVESAKAAGRETEIIVVDDASADDTAATCRALTGIRHIRLAHGVLRGRCALGEAQQAGGGAGDHE